ncbi:MAG TPA: hypothetical protein VGO50_04935 [Pyrinomonadaceae bacterium]|jgi:hypothetical protein|nr:hypothetical protein [Pyrinomonadaceae bacterium]
MLPSAYSKEITVPMAAFLNQIGIETRVGEVPDDTFVPGIEVRKGALIYDEAKLKYPGDLLHEAGHLAVMTPGERAEANATVETGPGEEMAAIAWSYAAALHINIDPKIVFHPDGYKGGSKMILENFAAGHYFGVPLLDLWEMAEEYPRMAKWLRD